MKAGLAWAGHPKFRPLLRRRRCKHESVPVRHGVGGALAVRWHGVVSESPLHPSIPRIALACIVGCGELCNCTRCRAERPSGELDVPHVLFGSLDRMSKSASGPKLQLRRLGPNATPTLPGGHSSTDCACSPTAAFCRHPDERGVVPDMPCSSGLSANRLLRGVSVRRSSSPIVLDCDDLGLPMVTMCKRRWSPFGCR